MEAPAEQWEHDFIEMLRGQHRVHAADVPANRPPAVIACMHEIMARSGAAARAPVAIAALGGGGVVLVHPGSSGHEVVLRSAEGTERPVLRGLPENLRYRVVAHAVAPRVAVEGVDADGATH